MMDEQACSGQSVCIKGSQLANAVLQCQLERHGESCVSRKNLRDFSPSRVSDMHLFALEFVLLLVLLTALLLLRVSTRRRRFDPDKFREAADKLAPAFREAEERLWATINGNPDNGRLGHWEVEGIRHRAIVKASSGKEAVERAKDIVGDWELMGVKFLGEQFPDVYGC